MFRQNSCLCVLALISIHGAYGQAQYDKAIFQKPVARDQLAGLIRLQGVPTGEVVRDKGFRALMRSFVPDCVFHYGRDMPLADALEMVLKGSKVQAQIRDGRYLMVSGGSGPYLAGRGFLWVDLEDGIGLGGFFFHPTNGEPTPTLTVFARQVREKSISLKQLPPEFAVDLMEWVRQVGIPPLTSRYFIGGADRRLLLEHDEELCGPGAGPGDACRQMEADAADIDLNTAYYLERVHYATNATAWMIVGNEQMAWVGMRDGACRVGPDPLRCRIGMTRERTRLILNRGLVGRGPRR